MRIRRPSTRGLTSAVAIVSLAIAWLQGYHSLGLCAMFARAEAWARNEAASAAAKGDARGAADMAYAADSASRDKLRCLSKSAPVLTLTSLCAVLGVRWILLRARQHIWKMPSRTASSGFSRACDIGLGLGLKSLALAALMLALFLVLVIVVDD